MSGFLTGVVTIIAMATFFGIVWWAWSARRKDDNQKASMLPFDLPDEYEGKDKNSSSKNSGDLNE